jgi:hypothetical protein
VVSSATTTTYPEGMLGVLTGVRVMRVEEGESRECSQVVAREKETVRE